MPPQYGVAFSALLGDYWPLGVLLAHFSVVWLWLA